MNRNTRAHRLVNAWEFAKLARQAAEGGKYDIAVFLLPLSSIHQLNLFPSSVISTVFQHLYP
jgi:DNA-binding IclR family transcriptional regulator